MADEAPSIRVLPSGSPGHVLLRPSDDVDPAVLQLYGARKAPAQPGHWLFPRRYTDLELLRETGLRLGVTPDLMRDLVNRNKLDNHLLSAERLSRAADHRHWTRIDPHQHVGVAFLVSRTRALLAFSPGLGKSATAIIAADVLQARRILILAPLSLHGTWVDEIAKWSEDTDTSQTLDEPARWTVTNPEQIVVRSKRTPKGQRKVSLPTHQMLDHRASQPWDLIIADESILYKERNAKRTEVLGYLVRKTPTLKAAWLLSGSPTGKYANDLWAQLNILRPEWFGSYWRFVGHWTHTIVGAWGTQIVGNKNPAGLRSYLRDIMISRTPEEVPVLPKAPVERIKVILNPRQVKALEEARDKFMLEGEQLKNSLHQLTRMAQVVSYPPQLDIADQGAKIRTLREMLGWVPTPALVWCWFRPTAEAVATALKSDGLRVGMIHGGVSASEREQLRRKYDAGKLDVLVLQIGTGKYGLSLTSSRTAIFYDRSFAVDDWIQASARVRRRSSTHVVPTYVLDAGWTDKAINTAIRKGLRSVSDLKFSDLITFLQ